MGGLLTLGSWVRQFPEINTVDHPGDNHIATIQGISVASYNVGCFVGAVITIFIGDILRPEENDLPGLFYHDRWRHPAMLCFQLGSLDRGKNYYWLW